MEVVINSALIVLWCFFAILEGMREACYYDAAMRMDTGHPNIHWMYFLQRFILLLVISAVSLDLVLDAGLVLIFPFIHDGMYYIERNNLDCRWYPNRFRESSKTSRAFFEFDYFSRTIMFIGGIVFIIASYLLTIYT
jgi:hypothetical protein